MTKKERKRKQEREYRRKEEKEKERKIEIKNKRTKLPLCFLTLKTNKQCPRIIIIIIMSCPLS